MTSSLTVRDFLLHYLKHEYAKRSKLLDKLILHTEKLNNEFIITNAERLKYVKSIDETIRIMNNMYNYRIQSINGISVDICEEDEGSNEDVKKIKKIEKITNLDIKLLDIVEIDNLDILYELCFTAYNDELKKYCPRDFEKVDRKIKEIMFGVGAQNISDIILFITGQTEKGFGMELGDKKELYDVINKSYIPLYVTHKNAGGRTKIKLSGQINIPNKYELLLGNFYKVEINVEQLSLNIYGFFEYDCINSYVRTAQICNKIVYDKKKYLLNFAKGTDKKKSKIFPKLNLIPLNFKEEYVKNMTIGELMSCDDSSFVNLITNDYSIYQKCSTINKFKLLFEEFIHADLLMKFKIIKFLLLNASTGYAGLLYGTTKGPKDGTSLSDIIYKNLSLTLQLKLQKANSSIKSEIEKINSLDSDDIDLKKQITLNKNIPLKVKKLALEKINEMKSGNSEYYKQLLYVKTLAEYPWIGENDGDIFGMHLNDIEKWEEIITNTHNKLHSKVYGHADCKETIVELLGKWFSNPKSLGKAIGLWGPPGVGKTLLAKELGDALGIPMTKINLGGVEDGAVLSGHSITYSGAVPGLIVKKMCEAGKPRCIMFFDELDKACFHHGRNEIHDILIHAIDSTSNTEFNDKFFQDVNFPINKVLFVFSFNNRDKIDPILLDRMEIIKVDAYSIEDKTNIVKNFLIKELKEDIGLNSINIKISDENIMYLINSFTSEAGVRSIRRKVEKIMLKINKDRIFKTGPFKKTRNIKNLEITQDMIDKYLVKPTILYRKIGPVSEVGTVNGLYATSLGDGGIIPILMYMNQTGKSEKFGLKLTGKQGKVMRESVSFAFTIAINLVKPKYGAKFFSTYHSGLHIHTPDGATTKDGPSAGSAFTLAFISKILNRKVKNEIAITGEIERDGCITAIGGLEYKLPGAKKAGVKLVFVPKENEKDIEKLKTTNKSLFDDNFRFMLVDHIKDVLDMALIGKHSNKQINAYEKLFESEPYLVKSCSNIKIKSKNNVVSESSSESDDKEILSDTMSQSDQTEEESKKPENSDSTNEEDSESSESYRSK